MDVFAPNLKRGAASLRHNVLSSYVEDRTTKQRVYLRVFVFLYEHGVPLDKRRFLMVHDKNNHGWEPIKGQVEKCDAGDTVMESLRRAALREVREEAKIKTIERLEYAETWFEGREKTYPPKHVFQYHVFTGTVLPDEIERARFRLYWYRRHPDDFNALHRSLKEKDDLDWYNADKQLFGRWSPRIVEMMLA